MRQTVTRLALLTALVTLGSPLPLFANDPWYKHCKHTCKSCEGKSNCTPGTSTYTVEATGESDTQDPNDPNAKCTVDHEKSLSTDVSGAPVPRGVTPLIYRREGSIFDGVSPDYVKYETVGGVKKPIQMPMSHSVMVFSDLADGSGHQTAQYPKSLLPAPNAQGVYTVPSGVEPISVTIYRNPDGPATTTSGNFEIVHKQRHPQSGIWITRTIRMHAPQNDNNWKTEFFLGSPATTSSYREITIVRSPHPTNVSEESTRETTKDRDSQGNLVITSDISATYGFYKYGAPVRLSETNHSGTGSDLTSNWTYYTDRLDQASFNKPATLRRNDGNWENYTYSGSLVTGVLVTKTVSGWLDQAAPAVGQPADENLNRVVVKIEANKETGTFGREEKIQGVLVSKTWGERYKDNAKQVIEKSREETGSSTLLTIRTGYPTDESASEAERGRLKSFQNPDGTVALHRYELQGTNRVETVEKGAGSLNGVVDGTRTISTYTKDDTLIKEVVVDIVSGVEISCKEVIGFDSEGEPTKWAYNHSPDDYSETLNGCCGIDSTRSRDGIVTTYTRDGLKRPLAEVSQGITLTYTYGKKSIGGLDYPTVNQVKTAGSLSLDLGTTVLNHSGKVLETIRPDLDGDSQPETATTIYDVATRTTTTTNPDGGTEIKTDYADGQSKSRSGTAVAPATWTYITHSEQGGGLITTQFAGDATSTRWTRSYTDLHGETFKTTTPGSAGEVAIQTNVCDPFCRLIKTTDADGVTTLFAYNAKGERYRGAIDLNQNGEIDANDRISDSIKEVVGESPVGPAFKERSIIHDLSNNPVVTSITWRSVDELSSRTEVLGSTGASTFATDSHLARADGAWTATTTNPDGTKQVVTYSNSQRSSISLLDTQDEIIQSQTIAYDALRRPIVRTDSRTGSVTTSYANSGLVASIDDHGRITGSAYDNMGRAVSNTLPDNSITHTSYWPTGRKKAAWGSQTNPVVNLYSPQGEVVELRTFRTSNLALAPDETTSGYDATTWSYNARGLLTQKNYADGKGPAYTYTAAGRRQSRTWARTVGGAPLVTTYGYNTAGEMVTTHYSDTTPGVTITFDKLGRQATATNGVVTSAFTYDPATLRPSSETLSYDLDQNGTPEITRVLDRSQDVLGRPTGYQLKNGTSVETQAAYGYSPTHGRLATAGNGVQAFTYDYLANSALIETVTGPAHSVTNTYAADRDVLLSKENQVGGAVVSKYHYAVNAIGQRSAVTQTGSAFATTTGWNWGYDALGQVTSAQHATTPANHRAYQYDAIGNRQRAAVGVLDPTDPSATPYTANNHNQYSSVGSATPIHDDDGNMTSGHIPAGSAGLVWDAENRLTGASITGGGTVHYFYDSQSRRIARAVGLETTFYIYDGWNLAAEYASSGSSIVLSQTYLWGTDLSGTSQGAGGVAGLLVVQNTTASSYPTYDGNGNVSEYLNAAGGIAAHFEYDSFGNTVVNTDSAGMFDIRFSTKKQDAETGLFYYGYRYYDPSTGRWPSRDPIEEKGGINLYGFVQNNVINEIDKLGQESYMACQLRCQAAHRVDVLEYGAIAAAAAIGCAASGPFTVFCEAAVVAAYKKSVEGADKELSNCLGNCNRSCPIDEW